MYFLVPRSILSVLITAVLAIGGCLPCQKLFAGEPSKKSCCNSKGECQRPNPETPAKKVCKLQIADVQSGPEQQADRLVSGSIAHADEPIIDSAPVTDSAEEIPGRPSFTGSSPPPLFLLNLSLLI